MNQLKVMKFGGTSVGKPERMRQVSQLITADAESKIVAMEQAGIRVSPSPARLGHTLAEALK